MISDQKIFRPIIFIGTGRSGTSIISEIISRHKDLAFPSNYQNKFPQLNMINLARLLFQNKFWYIEGQKKQLNKVNFFNPIIFKDSEAYRMWDYITGPQTNFSRSFLLDQKANFHEIEFIQHYFYKMIRYQYKNRLVFKITGPSRIEFLQSIFPDAYFIHLKRKIIPTINSFLNVSFWKQNGFNKLWWVGAYTKKELGWVKQHKNNPILLTAFQLNKILEITEYECNKCKPNILEIHYENFVKFPKKTIDDILNFVGLKKDTVCYNYLKKTQYIIKTNQMRTILTKIHFFRLRNLFLIDKPVNNRVPNYKIYYEQYPSYVLMKQTCC